METINQTSQEKQVLYNQIVAATYEWVHAKLAAERDDHMNAWLNLMEQDALAPIDRALDEIIQLNRMGDDYGE